MNRLGIFFSFFTIVFIFVSLFMFTSISSGSSVNDTNPTAFSIEDSIENQNILNIEEKIKLLQRIDKGSLIRTSDGNIFIFDSYNRSGIIKVSDHRGYKYFNLSDDRGVSFLYNIRNIKNKKR